MSFCKYVLLLGLLVTGSGCQLLWQGPMENVAPISDHPRAGNVYLVRGWIGFFSFGMDQLADELQAAGIRANVYQDVQSGHLADVLAERYAGARDPEPLILVGHSYGADDVVQIARRLNEAGVQVDLLVTLDPVAHSHIPRNVKRAYNIYRSNGVLDTFPWLRGVPLDEETSQQANLTNLDITRERTDLMEPGTNHFTIDKNNRVQLAVVRLVIDTCPPRQQWAAMKHASPLGNSASLAGKQMAPRAANQQAIQAPARVAQ